MNQIRLLPLVMVAVAGLLLVKVIGVVTGQGYVLSGIQTSVAQEAKTDAPATDDAAAENSESEPADEEPESEVGTEDKGLRTDPKDIEEFKTDSSERILLTRLADRRIALDKLERDLAMQRDLIDAAERRVEERFALLEALEAKIDVAIKAKAEEENSQFMSLVSMYELMKPKDAAAIFDTLNMTILVRVARGMKARKMADVLSRMSVKRAEALTIELANPVVQPQLVGELDELNSLPQIIGE